MNGLKTCASALTAIIAFSGAAHAHTSYVVPNVFVTSEGQYVTAQSAFTEDPFVPEIAVASDDFHVVLPDGVRDDFDVITPLHQVVILEESLRDEGTYRLTTGVRYGRKSQKALVDGKWVPVFGPDAQVPENATEVISSQTVTVADAYVTKGASTWEPVNLGLGRLVLRPMSHPNEIYLEDGAEFEILFDGKPLANQSVEVKREGGTYENAKFEQHIETDENGILSLSFDRAGKYLIMTRHASPAPEGAEVDEHSHTTSLTFEVAK